MILKGSQRGSGQNLAAHLLRTDENEHVRVHQMRGFAADDLHGAFKEAEAISRGTRCKQYLFSLSLSPPEQENVAPEIFEHALDRIERRLDLTDQPRAIVFHEKEGRRHAHCVWSRIDAQTMTAKQLSFFKSKLKGVSRELYLENGWKMPRGLENAAERNPANFTLAEWQQAKRQGIDPRWLKQAVQDCWKRSDDRKAFGHSLEERGLFLARGDRRGHVVMDHQGEVWSLPRLLDVKTKDVRARLGDGADLPSVEATQKTIGERMTPAIRRHVEEARERFYERSMILGNYKAEMTKLHRSAREKLDHKHETEWQDETRRCAARLPRGVKGLWHRLTGKYQEVRAQNEAEAREARARQAKEREELIAKQREQRAVLQARFKELRKQQAEQLLDLRKDIGRFLNFSREAGQSPALTQGIGLKLSR